MIDVNDSLLDNIPLSASNIFTCNVLRSDMTRKLYLKLFIGKNDLRPCLCLFDSGADLNIFSKRHLKYIFSDQIESLSTLIQPSDIRASSFTNQKIPLEGFIIFDVKCHEMDKTYKMKFYILEEKAYTPCPIILGMRSFAKLSLDLQFNSIGGSMIPQVGKTDKETSFTLDSYYITDSEIYSCSSKLTKLAPGQISKISLNLHSCSPLEIGEPVITYSPLTYNSKISALKITCSKSQVSKCKDTGNLSVLGTVLNDSIEEFNGIIKFQVESVKDNTVHKLNFANLNLINSYQILCDVDIHDSTHYSYIGKLVPESAETVDLMAQDKVHVSFISTEPTTSAKVNLVEAIKFPEFVDLGSNKDAINNDVANINTSLTDERFPIKYNKPKSAEDMAKFYNKDTSINLGIQHVSDNKFQEEILNPRGYSIPQNMDRNITDIIDFKSMDPDTAPYVKDIFVTHFPNVVARHDMDIGRLSGTLGRYKLQLKEGARLPKYKRIFYLAPAESNHMRDILALMIKQGIIEKSPNVNDNLNEFACSSFIVARKNTQKVGRLVIDYSLLNPLLILEPPVIPRMDQIINELRDYSFFSSLDVSQAFCSLEITDDSKYLTAFSTPFSIYYFKTLPTGANPSPGVLHRVMTKVVHYKVVRDSNNKMVFEKDNIVKMEHKPIKNAKIFFDDCIIGSKFKNTIKESRKAHFDIMHEIISRFNDHKAKLNVHKSQFFQPRICFLGWNIEQNFITPDQQRIQKVLDFPLPETRKGWQSFVGLVNSLRLVLGFDVLSEVAKITELCSEKDGPKKIAQPHQVTAFNDIKKLLVSGPIFARMILPYAPKILYTDASSAKDGSFSAVLCQLVSAKNRKNAPPSYLNLNDKCHIILLENNLSAIPADYYNPAETNKEYLARLNPDHPPVTKYLQEEFKGLTKETFDQSLAITLKSLFVIHNLSQSLSQIGQKCRKIIKTGLPRLQFLDFVCNNNKALFDNYVNDLDKGIFKIDKNFYIIEILAQALQRGIVVINGDGKEIKEKIRYFNFDKSKPPFYLLIQSCKSGIYVRPAYINKNEEYYISKHKGTLEIIGYFSKKVPEQLLKNHILDLENWAILTALYGFRKYIGNSECLLISDSKPLFYLFSNKVLESCVKLARWNSKLLDSYGSLKLGFCKSENNLSDFLSKEFDIKPVDLKHFKIPKLVSNNLDDIIDQNVYTLTEWAEFVNKHDHLLEDIIEKDAKINLISEHIDNYMFDIVQSQKHVNAITTRRAARLDPEHRDASLKDALKNVEGILTPMSSLSKYISSSNIIIKQKEELDELYNEVLTATDLTLDIEGKKYFIKNNILFINTTKGDKIVLPPSLLPYLIVFVHLQMGHIGYHKMCLNTDNYHCQNKRTYIEKFCKQCLPCALVNVKKFKYKLAYYPAPETPFYSVHADYIENLPPCGSQGKNLKNRHLIVFLDLLSGAILLYPVDTKTPYNFLCSFFYGLYQTFRCCELITDNAPGFVSNETVTYLAAMGITVQHTSSMSPASRGAVEQKVQHSKTTLKKMLTSCETYQWLWLPPALTVMHNTSKLNRHNMSPFSLVFGEDSRMAQPIWDTIDREVKIHPSGAKSIEYIKSTRKDNKKIFKNVQKKLDNDKINRNEKLNKNRKKLPFPQDAIVFIKNNKVIPGSTLPLKSKFVPSPWKILTPGVSCATVQRLSDGNFRRFHFDYMKRYIPLDPFFSVIPENIKAILNKPFENYTEDDIIELLNYDSLEIPDEAVIIDPIIEEHFNDDNEENDPHVNFINDTTFSDLKSHVQFIRHL